MGAMTDPVSPAPTVLFDLDGTLTDSAEGVVDGFRHACHTVGVTPPDGDLTRLLVGPPMVDSFAALGMDEATTERALAAYTEYYDRTGWAQNAVFDGIAELLDELRARGLRLAVATSKSEIRAVRILEHFGLADRFAVIAGASADGTRRAKADVIAHALAGLDVAGEQVLTHIGDREHDVAGALAHGIAPTWVSWGYGDRREAAGARWTVDDPAALRKVIMDQTADLHVTFVCTGNICRSPMAERILADLLDREGLGDRVKVTSAGIMDWHTGKPADPRTDDELRAGGYSTGHAAAQFGPAHAEADLIVAMDRGHFRDLPGAGADPAKVRLMRSFDPEADTEDVDDPYYGGPENFVRTRRELEAAMPALLDWIRDSLAR